MISCCYTPLLFPLKWPSAMGWLLSKLAPLAFTPIPTHGWFQGLWGKGKTKQKGRATIDLARQAWLGWLYINDDYDESLLYGVHAAGLGLGGGRWTGLLSFCRFLSLVCCFPDGVCLALLLPFLLLFFFRLILLLLSFSFFFLCCFSSLLISPFPFDGPSSRYFFFFFIFALLIS